MRLRFERWSVLVCGAMLMAGATGCHKKHAIVAPTAPDTSAMDNSPLPTATLSADPVAIDLGQSVVLNWRTTNASTVTIDGIGAVPQNGTQNVTPSASTNFHLTATSPSGKTAEANVRVTVRAGVPPTVDTSTSGNMGSDEAFHAAVQDVFFDYDSYDLSGDAPTRVAKAAQYMTQNPAVRIVLGGYCDERGSAEYNLALGENRANAVKSALVQAGIAGNRIRVISYGKEKQFCSEQNETCYAQNRRAQFNLDR